jgi:hypothetical protein
MKLLAIVEDSEGNVIGAQTDRGEIRLPKEQRIPRAKLAENAAALAAAYGVELPAGFTPPAPSPAPEENDSTPQGAD